MTSGIGSSGSKIRRGSIPLVLIIVTCLAVFAFSSLYMSQSGARLDKKSELNHHAWVVAQAAVEETLVKMSNGKADVQGVPLTYRPHATLATLGISGNDKGVQVDDVIVMRRIIRDKGTDPAKEKEFDELATTAPGFFKGQKSIDAAVAAYGGSAADYKKWTDPGKGPNAYNRHWRKELTGANAAKFDPKFYTMVEAASTVIDAPGHQDEGEIKEFVENFQEKEAQAQGDPKVGQSFEALKPLKWIDPNLYLSTDPVQRAKGQYAMPLTTATDSWSANMTPQYGLHTQAELAGFKTQWDECMKASLDQVNSRIAGCGGDANYGVGAMFGCISTGKAFANDSEPGEETWRDLSNDSGRTEYTEGLVTLSTKVTINQGMMSATQPYTVQRFVRTMNLSSVMFNVRKDMMGYFHLYYNLTGRDLAYLKLSTPADPTTGAVTASGQMLTVLAEGFPDNPGPQVRPFQVATCLGSPAK